MSKPTMFGFAILLGVAMLVMGGIVFNEEIVTWYTEDAPPVEPEPLSYTQEQEDNLVELKYFPSPELQILDFSVTEEGDFIFFGTNTQEVTLLDEEGNVIWEQIMDDDPLQTAITSCGNYVIIGTAGGELYYLKNDREIIWKEELDTPVEHMKVSPEGEWLVLGGCQEGEGVIEFYSREKGREWRQETGKLDQLKLSFLNEKILYTESKDKNEDENDEKDDTNTYEYSVVAVDLDGDELWELENARLRAFSESYDVMAVQDEENNLVIYDLDKDKKWEEKFSSTSLEVVFNENNEHLLVYDKFTDDENLHCFGPQGSRLWKKRIVDDAMLTLSPGGRHIYYASQDQHDDTYSKIIVLDERGDVVEELEVTVQVEKIKTAGEPHFLYLAGSDGSVYQINLLASDSQE